MWSATTTTTHRVAPRRTARSAEIANLSRKSRPKPRPTKNAPKRSEIEEYALFRFFLSSREFCAASSNNNKGNINYSSSNPQSPTHHHPNIRRRETANHSRKAQHKRFQTALEQIFISFCVEYPTVIVIEFPIRDRIIRSPSHISSQKNHPLGEETCPCTMMSCRDFVDTLQAIGAQVLLTGDFPAEFKLDGLLGTFE